MITSGEADFQERENIGPWLTHRIKKGSLFLTVGGPPYDCRWKAVTAEPFEMMLVFVALPILDRAFEEIFDKDAPRARMREASAFTDATLSWLMQRASAVLVESLANAIAIHLARNFAEVAANSRKSRPSLPGYKLRQITSWMDEHFTEDFRLQALAARAGLSKFHFIRLFKAATGTSPSRYHLDLRMKATRQLLRETRRSVIDIALDVGYKNPSRFAQVFRRETGLTPSEYRRQD